MNDDYVFYFHALPPDGDVDGGITDPPGRHGYWPAPEPITEMPERREQETFDGN